jgi:hypothetical protein
MRKVRLTNFKMFALVDDDDYDLVTKFSWYLSKAGYAARSYWIPDKNTNGTMYMHRLILGTSKGFDTEHKDQNKLNNQKGNLRLSTRSENMVNLKARSGSSKYKGVSKVKKWNLKKPWLSYIKVDYKTYYNGYHATEAEAAHIYNQFAEQVFGEFAYLNVIE